METLFDKVRAQICDDYCRHPRECADEEELEQHCSSCVLDLLSPHAGRSESDRPFFAETIFDQIAGTPDRISTAVRIGILRRLMRTGELPR